MLPLGAMSTIRTLGYAKMAVRLSESWLTAAEVQKMGLANSEKRKSKYQVYILIFL